MVSPVMAQKGVCVLLFFLMVKELLTEELQTILPAQTLCTGQSCLLPVNPPSTAAGRPARNFPWGTGIRVGVAQRSECNSTRDSHRLLKAVIEHVGLFKCTVLPPRSNSWDNFRRGIMDVDNLLSWKIDSARPSLYPHMQANICVVIKKMKPRRQTVIQTFTYSTWGALLVSVVSFSVLLWLTGNRGVILETFRTLISGIFIENKERSIANGLSLLLSAFGIIMITAFSANFMSFLAVSKEPVQPQTLAEVNDRVSTVYGYPALKQMKGMFCDSDDALCRSGGLIDKITKKWDISKELPLSMDTAYFINQELYEMNRRRPEWVDGHTGRSLTHMVPQCILAPAYFVFFVRSDWPDADRLSSMQQKAIEAGLNHKMRSLSR